MYEKSTIKHLNKPNISLLYQGNSELDMFLSVAWFIRITNIKI